MSKLKDVFKFAWRWKWYALAAFILLSTYLGINYAVYYVLVSLTLVMSLELIYVVCAALVFVARKKKNELPRYFIQFVGMILYVLASMNIISVLHQKTGESKVVADKAVSLIEEYKITHTHYPIGIEKDLLKEISELDPNIFIDSKFWYYSQDGKAYKLWYFNEDGICYRYSAGKSKMVCGD